MNAQASHVLLCLHYGIGDVVMELPAIEALRARVLEARITGLGAAPAVEVLAGDGRLDAVVGIQAWGIRHLGDPIGEAAGRQCTDWLRSSHFDLVLDASHAAHAIRALIHEQYTDLLDTDSAALHAALARGEDGLSALKRGIHGGWGLEVPASWHPTLPLSQEEAEWAERFLGENGVSEDCVALSPGASHRLKSWPAEEWGRLARFVAEDLGADVLLFCGPMEAGILEALTEAAGGAERLHVVQNLHLRKVAALLSRCRLYVGNDSGLMHLAAAVERAVVVLFGPTVARLYLPGWVRSRAVVSPVACPYRLHEALGHPPCVLAGRCFLEGPCIERIDSGEVYRAVEEEYSFPMVLREAL